MFSRGGANLSRVGDAGSRLDLNDQGHAFERARQHCLGGSDLVWTGHLGEHQRIGSRTGADDGLEVTPPEVRVCVVDPKADLGPSRRPIRQKVDRLGPGLVFCPKSNTIFEVDADRVGSGGQRLGKSVGTYGRNKEEAPPASEGSWHRGSYLFVVNVTVPFQ